MKVLMGPTNTITTTTSFDYPATSSTSSTASFRSNNNNNNNKSYLFIKEEEDDDEEEEVNSTRKGKLFGSGFSLSSSSSSSSIGAPDDTDDDEEDDVVSVRKSGSFACLTSLEDSLPIKRGLSSHYIGKSKSFGNLQDMTSSCTSANDFVKPENPFNKRRRILMANKLHRKSFYSANNPKSMPVLTSLAEQEEDEDGSEDHNQDQDRDHEDDDNDDEFLIGRGIPKLYGAVSRNLKASGFKTCFSLADLQEHDDEEYDQ
ncbi:hypothetical protein ACFE04_003124 [Oxalis oulophora]